MRVNVTAEQIAAAIKANEEALAHAIRDCGRSHPPGDGTIGLIVASLEALAKIEPAALMNVIGTLADGSTLIESNPETLAALRAMDEIDVGATDKGERVTVKKRVVHGRKDG